MFGTMIDFLDITYRSNLYLNRVSETEPRLRPQVKRLSIWAQSVELVSVSGDRFFFLLESRDRVHSPNGRLSKT